MEKEFQKKSVMLYVSQFDANGWWICNTNEHVAKGTALGDEYTETIYTPSEINMIGHFNERTGTWTERIDNRTIPFWDSLGMEKRVIEPDSDFPEWAIYEAPPFYDVDTHTVIYKDKKWLVNRIRLGESYYDEHGDELCVSECNFELPEKCTFTKPPEKREGFVCKLVDGQWQELESHIGVVVYDKVTREPFEIKELGPIPNKYTIDEPETDFDEYVNDEWVENKDLKFQYDFEAADDARRHLYSVMVDPLLNEAAIKRLQNNEDEAQSLERQALAAREKIQLENPYPSK